MARITKPQYRIFASAKEILDGRRPDDVVISESIGFVVSSTARVLGLSLSRALAPYGVAPAQWTILLHLWSEEGISQRELGRRIGIEEATVTRTVDRLVRDALIERRVSTEDKRQYQLYISEKGQALKATLVPIVQSLNRQATSRLTDADFQELIRLLRLVRESVDLSAI
jgi:DNA-binding MarR family transcriptional regulator